MTTAAALTDSDGSGLEYAQSDWYPVAMVNELSAGESRQSTLLGTNITLSVNNSGELSVCLLYTSPSPRDS